QNYFGKVLKFHFADLREDFADLREDFLVTPYKLICVEGIKGVLTQLNLASLVQE
ncbi:MAG: hypothetical protein ACI9S8_002684, partial [Chlamydiales bacterium]